MATLSASDSIVHIKMTTNNKKKEPEEGNLGGGWSPPAPSGKATPLDAGVKGD
jgi:hypothetical protein